MPRPGNARCVTTVTAIILFLRSLNDYIPQVLLDVDCGRLSYDDSLIAPTVRAAADIATNLAKGLTAEGKSMLEQTLSQYDISSLDLSLQVYLAMEEGPSRAKTLQSIFGKGKTDNTIHDTYKNCPTLSTFARKDLNRTMSPHESLCTSMLRHLNRTTISKIDLEEAFCRDIDSFNAAFIVSFIHFNQSPKNPFVQTDDGSRPENCPEVPADVCAVLHDSSTCSGGWNLNVTDGTSK